MYKFYLSEFQKTKKGPFGYFAIDPKDIQTANSRIKSDTSMMSRGLEVQEYFQKAGFECVRRFRSQVSEAERQSWDQWAYPGGYASVGCNYHFHFFSVWGAVFNVDRNDAVLGPIKLYSGTRME